MEVITAPYSQTVACGTRMGIRGSTIDRRADGTPGPNIPTADTKVGRDALALSMLTCAQQIDSKTCAYEKHIRPRRALVIDEQKGLVSMYPLFVHDGTRRGGGQGGPGR